MPCSCWSPPALGKAAACVYRPAYDKAHILKVFTRYSSEKTQQGQRLQERESPSQGLSSSRGLLREGTEEMASTERLPTSLGFYEWCSRHLRRWCLSARLFSSSSRPQAPSRFPVYQWKGLASLTYTGHWVTWQLGQNQDPRVGATGSPGCAHHDEDLCIPSCRATS